MSCFMNVYRIVCTQQYFLNGDYVHVYTVVLVLLISIYSISFSVAHLHILQNMVTFCKQLLLELQKKISSPGCKVTCHQKCYKKADSKCSQDTPKPVVVDSGAAPAKNRVFGVPLENLVRPGEKIPSLIDKLITSIELYGLYTEGLYRKSGAQTKVSSVDKNFCDSL